MNLDKASASTLKTDSGRLFPGLVEFGEEMQETVAAIDEQWAGMCPTPNIVLIGLHGNDKTVPLRLLRKQFNRRFIYKKYGLDILNNISLGSRTKIQILCQTNSPIEMCKALSFQIKSIFETGNSKLIKQSALAGMFRLHLDLAESLPAVNLTKVRGGGADGGGDR